MKYFFNIFIILINSTFFTSLVIGQEVKYIYLDNNHYEYIDYLINSGEDVPNFVFCQPYQFSNLFSGKVKSVSYNYFKKWE